MTLINILLIIAAICVLLSAIWATPYTLHFAVILLIAVIWAGSGRHP